MEENHSSLFPVGPAKSIPWEIISFLDSRGKKLQLWDVGSCFQTQKTATDTKLQSGVLKVPKFKVTPELGVIWNETSKMTDI